MSARGNSIVGGQNPFDKLPLELLELIFAYKEAQYLECWKIAAVCSRWRRTVFSISSLWTGIWISRRMSKPDAFRRMICRINGSLDHASTQLLDVYWGSSFHGKEAATLGRLLALRAPFSRWRSLRLQTPVTLSPGALFHAPSMQGFTALESLSMGGAQTCPEMLHIIGQTATARLVELDIQGSYISPAEFLRHGGESILKFVRTMKIDNQFSNHSSFGRHIFPPNVTNLHTFAIPLIPLPHIRHLIAKGTPLLHLQKSSFPSLITLDISFASAADKFGDSILFPSLTYLVYRGPSFSQLPLIHAPALVSLQLRGNHIWKASAEDMLVHAFQKNLQYNLTPSSLTIDVHVRKSTMIIMISRHIERLRDLCVTLPSEEIAQHVVEHLLKASQDTYGSIIYAILSKLTLKLLWVTNDHPKWRALARKLVDSPNFSSMETVFIEWKDGSSLLERRT